MSQKWCKSFVAARRVGRSPSGFHSAAAAIPLGWPSWTRIGLRCEPPTLSKSIDVLRQMVQFMAQRLMELDVEARCGAGYDEKNPERLNSRNGYRDRTWDTRAGSVELKIPSCARAATSPSSLEPGARPRRRWPP